MTGKCEWTDSSVSGSRLALGLAPGGEERLQNGGAFACQNAGRYFDVMVQPRVGQDLEAGSNGASFRIITTIDQARHSRLNDGPGAHAARFHGDIERGPREAIVAESAGGFPQNYNFGVRRGIAIADGAIAGACDNFAVVN